jgi:hypothetical protein
MTDELDLVARLRALASGRAQRVASHMQVAVRPDALVLACLAMAGEDTTIHAVACGRVGAPPEVWGVPDPRYRDDQYRLFAALGAGSSATTRRAGTTGPTPSCGSPRAPGWPTWTSSPTGCGSTARTPG